MRSFHWQRLDQLCDYLLPYCTPLSRPQDHRDPNKKGPAAQYFAVLVSRRRSQSRGPILSSNLRILYLVPALHIRDPHTLMTRRDSCLAGPLGYRFSVRPECKSQPSVDLLDMLHQRSGNLKNLLLWHSPNLLKSFEIFLSKDYTIHFWRLETDNIWPHETNGKADLRTRSGIASEHLFISSHCRFVVGIQ